MTPAGSSYILGCRLPKTLLDNYSTLRNGASGLEIGRPGRIRPDSNRESLKTGPPACLLPAGGPILKFSLLKSGRHPAWKADIRPGATVYWVTWGRMWTGALDAAPDHTLPRLARSTIAARYITQHDTGQQTRQLG